MIWDATPSQEGRLTTKQCFKNDWEIFVFWKGLRDFHQILVCFSNLFLRWNLFQQPILENMAYDKPFIVNQDTLQKVKNWRNHVFVTIQSDLQKSGIHSPWVILTKVRLWWHPRFSVVFFSRGKVHPQNSLKTFHTWKIGKNDDSISYMRQVCWCIYHENIFHFR